jgi:hypothetical protein
MRGAAEQPRESGGLMPYIDKKSRNRLSTALAIPFPETDGELNFLLTQVLLTYLGSTPGYVRINGAIGALECAKLELYRRVAVPYEEAKRSANGEVYP